MDIQVLKTFIAVCEYGGFTAAAEKLGYSQSTVSVQIHQLETELGTVLFDRIRRNTTPTAEGQRALAGARAVLLAWQKMEADLSSPAEVTGEVHLAMASSVCSHYFSDDYLAFRALYPGITLKITAAGTEHMFDMLRRNEADIVFTLDEHIYDAEFIICAESVENTHFVAAAGHPLAGREALRIEDLLAQPFYLTEPGMSYRSLLDKYLASLSMRIRPVLEIGSTYQICDLLSRSDAVSFLPDHVTQRYVEDGTLCRLAVNDVDIPVWNQILIHRNKWLSPAMQAVLDFYSSRIGGRQE